MEDITLTYSAPDFTNVTVPIATEDLTRAYTCGEPGEKHFTELEMVIESWAANWSLSAITDGVKEETIYRSSETKDARKFLNHDTQDFDAATEPERATLPGREDYAVVPTEGDNLVPEGAVYSDTGRLEIAVEPGTEYHWTPGNGTQLLDYGGAPVLLSAEGTFSTSNPAVLIDGNAGEPCTSSITEEGAVALPTEGLPLEPHQVYVLPIALNERDQSIQFRITNAAGSLRVRSLRLKAQPIRA